MLIDEGQLFNKRAWEVSILRLNQLDYFDKIEEDKAVEIKRNTKEGTVDMNLKVHEKGNSRSACRAASAAWPAALSD